MRSPVTDSVDTVLARGFSVASRLRGERAIHAPGVTFTGRVIVTGAQPPLGVPLLDTAAEHPALLRFSRGVGLPEGWPDVRGLAIRILDAHGPGSDQDLLVSTTVVAPL